MNTMNKTQKTKAKITDGVVCYFGDVDTGWTPDEVMAAFMDGYDTGSMERGETFECELYIPMLDPRRFTITADGMGGVLDEIGDYPYSVTWREK